MTQSKKFDFILSHLNIKTQEVAKRFGASDALISQLRSVHSSRLKPMHILALCGAFDIPIEIFNPEITTKEQIITLLNNHKKSAQEKTIQQNNILEGELFIYSHTIDKSLQAFLITIKKRIIFHKNEKVGTLHELPGSKIILRLEDMMARKIIISIEKSFLNKQAFFAFIEKKELSQRLESDIGLISSSAINKKDIQTILQRDKKEQKVAITHAMLETLQEYLYKEETKKSTFIASENELSKSSFFHYTAQKSF